MERKWEQEIDEFIKRRRDEIVEQVCRLIRIESVSGKAEGSYPYGAACARALDFCGELAGRNGLFAENYDYYGLEIRPWRIQGENGEKKLLLAAHADVVPASSGNIYPAFGGTVDKGYIIGRGAVDDKGPLMALLYTLIFLREQGIRLPCDVRLFVGSHEETDMEDLKYYLKRAGQPDFGLAADDDFPITNGEKSLLKFKIKGALEDAETDRHFWERLLGDKDGEVFGLNIRSERYGSTVCRITEEKISGEAENSAEGGRGAGRCVLADLRLPVCQELREARKKIFAALKLLAGQESESQKIQGISVEFIKEEPGYYISADEGIPKLLVDLYHEAGGREEEAYIMEGCTYARHFRPGCGFGAGDPREKKPFPPGHGSAHGPDEAHNIEVLMRAVKLDILGVLAIADYWGGKQR